MKIGIVTVYNTSNYGSQLQALALKKYLLRYSSDVFFIEHHKRNRERYLIKDLFRSIIKKDMGRFLFCFKRYRGMKRNKFYLPVYSKEKYSLDYCIFGSDEIWNMHRRTMKRAAVFWGKGINAKVFASYAVSVNNASESEMMKAEAFRRGLERFDCISVRDAHSKRILSKLISKKITVCVDPTLLWDQSWYDTLENPVAQQNFILVYAYAMSEEEASWCLEFARKEKMEIVSVGNYFRWCDKCIPGDIFDFLGYMHAARYVYSNTFHGTVFSVIYHKNFVSFGVQKKVRELLSQINLSHRYIASAADMNKQFGSGINYGKVENDLQVFREMSRQYLEHVFGIGVWN